MLPGACLAAKEVDMAWMGGDEHPPKIPEGSPASADQTPDIEDTVIAYPKAHPTSHLTLFIDLQASIAHGTFTISNSGL